jgi:ATP-binding cassette subfamily B protein
MAPLNDIHRVIDEGHEASLCLGDLLDMLHIPIDRAFQTEIRSTAALKRGESAITVEDLNFEYITADGIKRKGLDGIVLRINHGETIGVAGRSGSGKSTWIKALLRTIHPSSGQIFIAGIPLEDFGRSEIAKLVGYVGQNPFIFSGTIRENVAYGNDEVDLEAIHRAVELANLKEEIEAMPLGYETLITERGQNLSGGQRQRIAIARILLKQAPLLVLDEATSALDNISERNVQRALGITHQDRTTIMVAHRLTTLKDCDRILVFDNGQIVEEGDYEMLINRNGLFADLVASGEQGVSVVHEQCEQHAN